MEKLLDIKDLSVHYLMEEGTVKAVNSLTFDLMPGESIGLVGETGAGKTTTALSILRLVQSPPGVVVDGRIEFNGKNLLLASEAEMREIRGSKISMIFQDPMTSLNPVFSVGDQIAEVVKLHNAGITAKDAMKRAEDMLDMVGIQKQRYKEYPHQFSGGMRQRIVIAIALACNPTLLISDEPTTALDVTIQAQVLELMKGLKKEFNTSMIMITHDLGIVADFCDKVAIMYAGSVVELADKRSLFTAPRHPYTVGLFGSIPDISKDEEMLRPIPGLMPDPMSLPGGCAFHPRCERALPECSEKAPGRARVGESHYVSCLLYADEGKKEEGGGE